MRANFGFLTAVGLGFSLLSVACSSKPSGPTACTDQSGCAAGEYCLADGGCAPQLAAGAPCADGTGHKANDLCSSSLCAGGNCCTAACTSTDPACASTGCSATGACLYPDAGATCGTAAGCNGANFLPASTCNGAGGCTAATPVACAPYLCQNGGCSKSCKGSAECDTGNYCSSGLCVPKEDPGANCNGTSTSAPGEACGSNFCIGNHCCAAACLTTDPICHVSSCDTTGACIYPSSSITCGPLEQCVAGEHTPPSGCSGDGTCVLSTAASCGVYNCDAVGKSCYTKCTVGDDSPCTTGNFCKAGACSPQQAPGAPCFAPNACISGICQTNCCAAACGVDATSNCLGTCDNTGACGHPSCTPGYGCSGTQVCNTSCAADTDCAPGSGYTCSNPVNGSCCLPPVAGGIIYVDGKLGSDTNCCDSAGSACMTLTHAMKLAFNAGVSGITLNVTWNGTPTVKADWNPATPETYPIHLGLGVTLKAPGIFFTPPAGSPPIDAFDVFAYNATDTGRVTIEGDPAVDYVYIGIDSTQSNLQATSVAVNAAIGTAVPITLTDVWMNAQSQSINLGAGANVTLGPDHVIIGSGANTATPLTGIVSPGTGILCQGSATAPATLQDDPAGVQVLEMDSQDANKGILGAIKIVDNCDVTLSQSPIIGNPPPCPTGSNGLKVDGEGVLINGASTFSMTGGIIQCNYNHGIDIGETSGAPTVILDNSLVQYTGQTAIKCNAGSIGPVTNSKVFHCRFGVVQQGSCLVDFSGGNNVVSCSKSNEPGAFGAARAPGIDMWNSSVNNSSMNAANMLWDVNPPDVWSCNDGSTYVNQDCTCQSGSCTGTGVPSPDDASAVWNTPNTNAAPIDTSDGGLQKVFPVCN